MDAVQTMTNSDFLSEVYTDLQPEQYGWVCNFRATPDQGEWAGRPYRGTSAQAAMIDGAGADNTYFCTAVLSGMNDRNQWVRQKATFDRLAVLVVDDVNPEDIIGGYSYAIQTSPGKWQVGILLDADDPDCANAELVDRIMRALSVRGRSNDGSGNACVRYVRLPEGSNTKPRAAGVWRCQLAEWSPSTRWTLADACAAVEVDLDALRAAERGVKTTSSGLMSGENVAGDALSLMSGAMDQRSYHDAIVRMAASLVAGGMFPGAAVAHLYSLMDAVRPSGPPEEVARWAARRAEIPRAVKTAEKFAPPERAPVTVNVRLGAPASGDTDASGDADPEFLLGLDELARRSAAVRWGVKAVIPADSIGMLFGASGTFKSFIALDHSLHVAHGLDWMGRRTQQGPVVYVAAEGGAGIFRRVDAWHREFGLTLADNFRVCVVPLVLSISEHVEALASAIAALPVVPVLVYVDTLSQTFEGDENSATDVSAYLRLLNSMIRARFACTVIVVHHSGHAATERPRGSSAITANVDFMLGVYRPDVSVAQARLDVIKQKDGDKLSSQGFELKRLVLGHDEDGDEVSSLVAVWNDITGRVLAAAAVRLNAHEQVVMGLLSPVGEMREHDLRQKFYDAFGIECKTAGREYKMDNARKAWNRALASLSSREMLNITTTGTVRMRDYTGTAQ